MKTFTAKELRTIRPEIEDALGPIAKKYGINFTIGSMRYSASDFTAKITCTINDKEGKIVQPYEKDFRSAQLWDKDMKNLGDTFEYLGEIYKISGWKPRSYKYPLLAIGNNGKMMKFPKSYVY